jgi:hypothetical protein
MAASVSATAAGYSGSTRESLSVLSRTSEAAGGGRDNLVSGCLVDAFPMEAGLPSPHFPDDLKGLALLRFWEAVSRNDGVDWNDPS